MPIYISSKIGQVQDTKKFSIPLIYRISIKVANILVVTWYVYDTIYYTKWYECHSLWTALLIWNKRWDSCSTALFCI